MSKSAINKYIWLVNLFTEAGSDGLTLSEVVAAWERDWGTVYSRRSFNNHRIAIADIFGIEIECDRRTNRYYIPFSDDVKDIEADNRWLIDTFTLNNLLSLATKRLGGRISVEEIPSGRKHLSTIIKAMEKDESLLIDYRKYGADAKESLNVDPYGLKEYQKRWYLVGYCRQRAALRSYSLDRIVSASPSTEHFTLPRDFDINSCFSDSYGVYLPDGNKSVRIVFAATEREAAYLEDLPIHSSQRRLKQKGPASHPVIFSIRVIPNESLIMELCRYGDRIRITEPSEVVLKVEEAHRKAALLYSQTNDN